MSACIRWSERTGWRQRDKEVEGETLLIISGHRRRQHRECVLHVLFKPKNGTREKTDLNQTKQQHLESVQRFNNPVYSLKLRLFFTAESWSTLTIPLIHWNRPAAAFLCVSVGGNTSDTGGTGQSPGVNVHEEQWDKSLYCCSRWRKTAGLKDFKHCPFNAFVLFMKQYCSFGILYSRRGRHQVEQSCISWWQNDVWTRNRATPSLQWISPG